MYTGDLLVGENYSRLNNCISIAILDFNLTDRAEYHSVYKLRDTEGNVFSDVFEIHTIELRKKLTGNNPINDWIRFFNAESEEDLNMIKSKNVGIQRAKEALRNFSLNPHLKLRYEAYLKERRDRIAIEEYEREQLEKEMAERLAKGLAERRAEGRAEGLAEGLEQSIALLIHDNLEDGKSEEIILSKLMKHFNFTQDKAKEYYDKYTR